MPERQSVRIANVFLTLRESKRWLRTFFDERCLDSNRVSEIGRSSCFLNHLLLGDDVGVSTTVLVTAHVIFTDVLVVLLGLLCLHFFFLDVLGQLLSLI